MVYSRKERRLVRTSARDAIARRRQLVPGALAHRRTGAPAGAGHDAAIE